MSLLLRVLDTYAEYIMISDYTFKQCVVRFSIRIYKRNIQLRWFDIRRQRNNKYHTVLLAQFLEHF
jgi:hypothetical protein